MDAEQKEFMTATTETIEALSLAVEAVGQKVIRQHGELKEVASLLELAADLMKAARERLDANDKVVQGLEFRVRELEKGAL